jgi:hypothetical protein
MSTMTDPRVAALAEAMEQTAKAGQPWATYPEWATAILAALPPDWCGHDPEGEAAARQFVESITVDCGHEAEIARLRAIEEAARAFDDGKDDAPLYQRWAALRAALGAGDG